MEKAVEGRLHLADLITGEEAFLVKVLGHGAFRKRITEMGFIKGKRIKVIKNAPLLDPIEYELLGYRITLRREEAALIEVVKTKELSADSGAVFNGTLSEDYIRHTVTERSHNISVALVGNPNSGKTTLFNYATGKRERVGNYSGVTVDLKEAQIEYQGYKITFTDLPGTYSISEYSPEELYVRQYIAQSAPDIVINVVDASNLERNLFLTTQLIDMNIRVVMALNMYDELEARGDSFDYDTFGKLTGIPVIPTTASKGKGIKELLSKVIGTYENREPTARHTHINYGPDIEASIIQLRTEILANKEIPDLFYSRHIAIKLLEDEKTTIKYIASVVGTGKLLEMAKDETQKLEKLYGEKTETIIADAKYGFINGALRETYAQNEGDRIQKSHSIDTVLTHKYLGFPFFFAFLWLTFQLTFTLGSYPTELIDNGVSALGQVIKNSMAEGSLRSLIVDGIIGGVGGVVVFLPNILILFFCISLMEDTGYMARAAFIMDRLMHKIGLHGKSFIPLIMGFGCNVPAIMATRTLENRKDRLVTMLILPFMSCSARLPVYVLLISAFFPNHRGGVLFSIYLIGILLAILMALLFKRVIFRGRDVPFVMELPPYRMPTLRSSTRHMWSKSVQYIRKMGTVILAASVIIWALGHYPKSDNIENSYIGRAGHFIEPAIAPLGFDWKIGVSIVTGLAAKEIIVGTMGVLYQSESDHSGSNLTMKDRLTEQYYTSGPRAGEKVFTPLSSYSLMLFILIYFPCVATLAAIKKEAGMRWAIFTSVYTTAVAWLVAFIVYQTGSLLF